MNFRRGFKRLFLVRGVLYYLIGGWVIYDQWAERIAIRTSVLADVGVCPGGHPKPLELFTFFQVYDEKTCKGLAAPVEWDWTGTLVYALFPAFLYGAWRLLSWIGRGFKVQPQVSN